MLHRPLLFQEASELLNPEHLEFGLLFELERDRTTGTAQHRRPLLGTPRSRGVATSRTRWLRASQRRWELPELHGRALRTTCPTSWHALVSRTGRHGRFAWVRCGAVRHRSGEVCGMGPRWGVDGAHMGLMGVFSRCPIASDGTFGNTW